MGRKARNRAIEDSIARIQAVLSDSGHETPQVGMSNAEQFAGRLREIANALDAKGIPDITWDRTVELDTQRGRFVYFGLLEDLRYLCDSYGLWWREDGPRIITLVYAIREGIYDASKVEDLLTLQNMPPALHWQWFRMAKSGLGIVRNEECRQPKDEKGLSYDVIALRANVSRLSVQRAVNGCWEYLQSYKGPLDNIADQAGLSFEETLMTLMWRSRRSS